jgi:flavorubredoxin
MLMDLLHIEEDRFLIVNEGDKLSLGGKTLTFYLTPWVHWPETMSTYLIEDGILFTCDFFGAHIASSEIFSKDDDVVYEEAKRYYAEIMMPFRVAIRKNLKKVREINPKMIAPSHGLVYKNPDFIISAYEDWVSDNVKNEVVVAYVSMHGSTEAMVYHLYNYLVEAGIEVKMFNLTKADIGEYAIALVDTATIVGATPTVLGGMHPAAAFAALLTGELRPKAKLVGIMGSYGWGGMMVEQAKALLKGINAEFLEPLLIKGLPRDEDYKKIEDFGQKIVEKHKELGLM